MTIDIFTWTKSWALARGLRVWAADSVGSTNSVAKDDNEEATSPQDIHPTLYLARKQTSGRGRGDHTWTTPNGSAFLGSWSYSREKIPQPIFSALVGLALYESLQKTWPKIDFNMKAPNDIFINDKKVAGILIEMVDSGRSKRIVVGTGINVSASPKELGTATSLLESGCEINEEIWKKFLFLFGAALIEALSKGSLYSLADVDRGKLKDALNRHPLLQEPILRVDELGQLHSASRTVLWHEL